jgi:hypothetical protein
MTPQQAYEKRYAAIDGGRHTWDVAPPHVKDLWLDAWGMAESAEREACATVCTEQAGEYGTDADGWYAALGCAEAIRERGGA